MERKQKSMRHRIPAAHPCFRRRIKATALLLMLCLLMPMSLLPAVAEGENNAKLTNVALGQTVTATSSYIAPEGFFGESLLVDGEWETIIQGGNVRLGWNSDVYTPTAETDPVDVTVELDGTYAVRQIVIKPMKWNLGKHTPKAFDLQYSLDGVTFVTLRSEKDVNTEAATDVDVKPLVYDINPTDMKYFRIHITRHGNLDAGGSWFSSLGELELFAMVEEKPEEEGELAVNKYALRMNPGETDWLYLTDGKKVTAHPVRYASTNEKVVSVDADGTVHSVATGEATVRVTDTETGKTYEVPVTVDNFRVTDQFQIVAFIPYFYEENINPTTFDNLKKGGITNVEINFALDKKAITYENNLRAIRLAYERGLDVTVSEVDFNAASWPGKSEAETMKFIKRYSHLPGVTGYYVVDEPVNATPYAKAVAWIKSVMPNAVAHVNFCGAYDQNVTNLQNELQSKYGVSLDYVMYDAYTFRNPTCDELTLYSQLAYNREIGQRLGVPTATYIQSMAWNGCNRPDADAIRYQVYASLAAGVKQISYFCWQTPRANAAETYGPAVIDIDGNPTDLMEPVSKINAAVQALGPTLMKLETRAMYFTGQSFGAAYKQLPAGFFIRPEDWDQRLAISYMEEADGRAYSMLVNRDYKNATEVTFTVDAGIKTLYRVSPETGKLETLTAKDGKYTVRLDAGEGALLACDKDFRFEMKEVTNFHYLKKAVTAAKALNMADYRDDGKDAFLKALEDAQTVLNNKNAKQSEVNTALRALQKAQVVLRPFANGTVNLALNKVVSSRNTYEDGTYFSLSFLTDGVHEDISVNSHQGWSVDPYSRLDRDAVVDLTLDLDAVYRITSVKLRPCLYNQGNSMPEDFEIQLSRDGKEFVTVKTVEGLMLEEALDQTYTVDAVEARYIRIHITKHSAVIDVGQGGALSQIGEIEVYGKDIDEPPTAESATETETTAPETKTETASETTHTDESSADSTTAETAAVTAGGTAETATGGTGSKSGCGSAIGGVIAVLALVVLAGASLRKKNFCDQAE